MTYMIRIVSPDIYWHAAALVKFIDAGSFPIPPGYPFVLWLLSGFQNSLRPFLIGANIVLPLFMLLQIYIAYRFFHKLLYKEQKISSFFNWSDQKILFLSIAFFLMAPVYLGGGTFYFGRIALNVWHNPTYIAMAPFALALFIITPRYINNPTQHFMEVLITGIIVLLFKPSFLFAWIPAVFLYGFIFKSSSTLYLVRLGLPLLSLGLLIIAQYYFIYVEGMWENIAYSNVEKRSVEFGFSKAWPHLLEMGNISLLQSLISSFLFPLLFIAFYGRSGAINEYTRLSMYILFFGILIVIFVYEGGNRVWEGNFFWTGYSANLTFFLACIVNFLQIQQKRKFKETKSFILSGVFILHLLSGIAYMVYILITGSYA